MSDITDRETELTRRLDRQYELGFSAGCAAGREAGEELRLYKEKLRAKMIELGEHYDWCEQLDRFLVHMGLEPRERDYRVVVRVTAVVDVNNVTAHNCDEAMEMIRNDMDRVGLERNSYYTVHNGPEMYVETVEVVNVEEEG